MRSDAAHVRHRGRHLRSRDREVLLELAGVHRWAAEVMPGRTQGYFVGPLLSHHLDELLDDLGVARKRTPTRLDEYLLPLWPTRYRGVSAERRHRAPGTDDNTALAGVARPPGGR
jgi:hypothetical protein